jgi:hypothetical protein
MSARVSDTQDVPLHAESIELCRVDPEYLGKIARLRRGSAVAMICLPIGGAFFIYYEWRLSLGLGERAALAFPLLAVLLVALGEFGFWFFHLSITRSAGSIQLDSAGFRTTLRNGRTFELNWADSRFAVDIVRRGPSKPPRPRIYTLEFRPNTLGFVEITEFGAQRLREVSTSHGLRVTERQVRRDLLAARWTIISIRNPSQPIPRGFWPYDLHFAVIGTEGQRAGRPRSGSSDEVGRALIMAAERSEGTVARERDRGLDEGSARPMSDGDKRGCMTTKWTRSRILGG